MTTKILPSDAECMLQELGPWCAAAVLLDLLRSKQVNNLLDLTSDMRTDNKYSEDGPDSAAIKKTPGAHVPSPITTTASDALSGLLEGGGAAIQAPDEGQDAPADRELPEREMADVFPVKKPAPVTPEVQALNVALKEVAKMLTQALPLSKRRRLASAHGQFTPELYHNCTLTVLR